MAKKARVLTPSERVERKLDDMIKLLQDLFIVEACRAGVDGSDIRKHLGVRNVRVSTLAKHIE